MLSSTTVSQVLTKTFTSRDIGQLGLASYTFGDQAPLAYGQYKLSLTVQDVLNKPLITRRLIEVQARPVITGVALYQASRPVRPSAPAPFVSPLGTFRSPQPFHSPPGGSPSSQAPLSLSTPASGGQPTIWLVISDTLQLHPNWQGRVAALTATLELGDPDSPPADLAVAYAWDARRPADWRPLYWSLDGRRIITTGQLSPGPHTLAFRVTDPDGNLSRQPFELRVTVLPPPDLRWLWVTLLLALAGVGGLGLSLLRYPTYAVQWAAAGDYPLQQIIPLIAPLRARLEGPPLAHRLEALHAFSTPEQVQDALEALAQRGLLRREGQSFRLTWPWWAYVHRLRQNKRLPLLAERVRTQHPLYARTRDFFSQARFHLRELSAEEFLLTPQGEHHPQAHYGPMYVRLAAGRAPSGDDFTAVCQAAQQRYGGDMAQRVAALVSDRRPEPGARYRLYEIREKEGLAIAPLDSGLFGQVRPGRSAADILAAELDQAAGRQNLYAISGPVSSDLSFFGRERVLQEVIDLLEAGQPVGLFGLRKVGKTSLVQRLQGHMGRRRPTALVDTQGGAREQGVWPLYVSIIAAFAAHLKHTRPDLALPALRLWPEAGALSPAVAQAFMQDLHALHAALGEPAERERLLLIVDEVDRLLPAGDAPGYEGLATLLGQLRAANQQARMLDLMVVGVDPALNRVERWQAHDYDNEMYRALREVWMPPMRPADVREMIESLGFQMGVRYEPAALESLVQAGGGQPFVTRQMCSLAVAGRLGRGAITITSEQARTAIEEFVFHDPYLGEVWRTRLDDAQRDMLRALARASAPLARDSLLPASQRQEALAALGALQEYAIVCRQADGYVIGWDVFRAWIRWVELGLED